MNKRLPLLMSATALAVALVGSTPLGQAAESALEQVVPRAKKADFAANAGKLNGHQLLGQPHARPDPGRRPERQARRRRSAQSVPRATQGPPDRRDLRGCPDISASRRTSPCRTATRPRTSASAAPAAGRCSAEAIRSERNDTDALFVFESRPVSDSTWRFKISNETGGAKPHDPLRRLRERRPRRGWTGDACRSDDRHCSLVAELLANGEIVPFLGAGANLCDRPDEAAWELGRFAPSGGELAQTLATSSRYPDADLDLLRVSQYVDAILGEGRLYRYLHEVFDSNYPPTSAAPPLRAPSGGTARARAAPAARS